MDIAQLLNQDEIKRVEEIHKGWSSDQKYYIQLNNGEELLLRMAPLEQFTRKVVEFDAVKKLFEQGMPVPKPLDIKGVEEEVYSLYRWEAGEDANDVIPTLSNELQYELGYQSGEMLRKMHQTVKVPADTEEWNKSYSRKIDRNIKNYVNGDLKYEHGDLFIEYIEKNRSLIKNLPLSFQHGDYYSGNMILSEENQLSVIDFNRWDSGDPFEEFNRIDFTALTSPNFATGQLDGYFGGTPPLEFFQLLLLYISVNTLNALPWAQNYSEAEVQTMRVKADSILKWYDNMKQVVPSWYKRC